jgi:outer membrane protein assembly factor BamB
MGGQAIRMPWVRGLVCWVASAIVSWGDTDPVNVEIARLDEHVAALRAVRDRLQKELQARPAPAEPAHTVTLTFPGLLDGGRPGDLTVTLRRGAGAWLSGAARPDAADCVDAKDLAFADDGKQRRLTGVLRIRFAPDFHGKPAFCEDMDVSVAVDARVSGEELQGTYRTEGYRPIPEMPRFDYTSSDGNGLAVERSLVPPSEGAVRGRVAPARWMPMPVAASEEDIVRDSAETIAVKRAQFRDQTACGLYRQIRAYALALDRGVDAAHALDLMPDYRPVWPVPVATGASGKAPKKSAKTPDLADIGEEDLGVKDEAPSVGAAKPAPSAATSDTRALATVLRSIRAHVEDLRRLAEQYRPGAPVIAPPARGDSCSDPDFGPWFGEGPLPGDAARRNVLPAEPATDGPQDWRRVEGWRLIGPFPYVAARLDVAALPEVVPAFDAGLSASASSGGKPEEVEADDCEPGKAVPAAEEPVIKATGACSGLGLIAVPVGAGPKAEVGPASFYGGAEVLSPDEREAWMGVQIKNGGALWVNDECVWQSLSPSPLRDRETAHRFPVRLRKGPNRLLLRVDNHGGDAFFAVRVCVRGRPRTAEESASHEGARRAAYARLASATRDLRGWRGDWTGLYPNVRPPLAWDLDRKLNVLWELPLGLSHATPVIAGERLFVLEDPATLVCLDKRTGAILWRQEADLAELVADDVKAKIAPLREQIRKAENRLRDLGTTDDERRKKLVAEGLGGEQADAALKELGQTVAQVRRKMLQECGVLGPAWGDWTGHTFSTPVTDGQHIWFKSNTGVVACYDLDGKRKWMVRHDGTTGTNAHTPSPALADGRLIVMLGKPNLASAGDYTRADSALLGYDAVTGALLWRVDTAVGVVAEVTGTPLPLRLTNGKDVLDVVVTADGSVVRAEDGAILRMHLGTRERYGSPTWLGADRVCFSGGDRGQAFRSCYQLLLLDRDHVGAKLLWHTAQPGTLYDSGDYQLVCDGRIFSYGARLDVLEAETGAAIYRSSGILWRRPGRCYSPLALAGPHLFVGDLGNWFGMKKSSFHDGALSVTTADRRPVVLARNRVGRTNAAPVFDDERLYVRQWYSLLCLAVVGDAGRRYEAEAVAGEALETLFPGRPSAGATEAVPARSGEGRGRLTAGRMPEGWVLVGPVPAADADAVRAHLLGPDLQTVASAAQRADTTLRGVACRIEPVRHRHSSEEEYGIRSHIVSKVGQEFMARKERLQAEGEPNAWTESVIMGDSGYPGSTLRLRGGAVPSGRTAWLVCVVQNTRRRTLRFELGLPGGRAWVNGRELRHGQLADLPDGAAQMVVEAPGVAEDAVRRFAPRFWISNGFKEDLADWLAGVEQRRPYLENAVRLCGDSEVGRRAQEVLRMARE